MPCILCSLLTPDLTGSVQREDGMRYVIFDTYCSTFAGCKASCEKYPGYRLIIAKTVQTLNIVLTLGEGSVAYHKTVN